MKYTWEKTGHGAKDNLGLQMQKIVRNMNENKFETRWRYIAAQKRFIGFVAKECKLQKLSNVQDKHLEKYVEYLKEQGRADKYIKNELSAIRFFHNQTPGTKYELCDSVKFNKSVGLGSTPDGRVDRAWTEREIQEFKDKAIGLNRPQVAIVFEAIRATGMRIDEVCNVRWQDINNALKTGTLSLDGSLTKGSVPRDVPLTQRAKDIFQYALKNGDRGGYAFTPIDFVKDHKIHSFEKSVQNFIGYHRNAIQDTNRNSTGNNVKEDERGALTCQGLRHSFAREQYLGLIEQGLEKEQARLEVSHMLGHGRDSVTYIYLGGIE